MRVTVENMNGHWISSKFDEKLMTVETLRENVEKEVANLEPFVLPLDGGGYLILGKKLKDESVYQIIGAEDD